MPPRPRAVHDDSPDISINLDTLERETPPAKPFSAVVKGTRYVFRDVNDIDWKVIVMAEQNPMLFVSSAVEDKQRDEFIALDIPSWKMQKLITMYREHFGIPTSPESAALSTS